MAGGAVAGGAMAGDAEENKAARRLSRRRASVAVQALEGGGLVSILAAAGTRRRGTVDAVGESGRVEAGGAESAGAASGGASPPADDPNDRDGRRLSDRSARRLQVSNSLIEAAAAQAEDRRREETDAEAAARAEGALVKLRKIGTIAAVASQRAKLWAGRHYGPQPQLVLVPTARSVSIVPEPQPCLHLRPHLHTIDPI